MITQNQTQDVIGATAYDADGDKIGKVGQLFLDDQTGQPAFVTVNTGLFGTKESYIPVAEATFNDSRLTVPYDKDRIKGAPSVDLDGGHLDVEEEGRLYEYYGLSYLASGTDTTSDTTYDTTRTAGTDTGTGTSDSWVDSGTSTGTGTTTGTGTDLGTGVTGGTDGYDTSGPTTDDAMTRSEERLDVGTERREAGRARLRKFVTTEHETRTVPVEHERAVVTSEPITEGNIDQALDGPSISEEEHEVVLHEEHAVVDKHTEAVERVALHTETEVGEETVDEELRKENIEVEGDVTRRDQR